MSNQLQPTSQFYYTYISFYAKFITASVFEWISVNFYIILYIFYMFFPEEDSEKIAE